MDGEDAASQRCTRTSTRHVLRTLRSTKITRPCSALRAERWAGRPSSKIGRTLQEQGGGRYRPDKVGPISGHCLVNAVRCI